MVHLVEEKVFTQFSDAEKTECRRWVLDTGTTNHMTGYRSAFFEFDQNIHGTVKFGDGTLVQIEGMGTILFSGKNGDDRAFLGIYYILRLNTNIISVGQLNEIGFQIVIEGGVMRIIDLEHRLLAMVLHSVNRLYILEVELARPVCLAAKTTDDVWIWHARFGHLNFPALRKLAREDMV
jgi:hypothetical protein